MQQLSVDVLYFVDIITWLTNYTVFYYRMSNGKPRRQQIVTVFYYRMSNGKPRTSSGLLVKIKLYLKSLFARRSPEAKLRISEAALRDGVWRSHITYNVSFRPRVVPSVNFVPEGTPSGEAKAKPRRSQGEASPNRNDLTKAQA
jgi:hypothetical protein